MLAVVSTAFAAHHNKDLPAGCGKAITAKQARPFIDAVWSLDKWERGMPPKHVTTAWAHKLGCAGPGNRVAMKKKWGVSKRAYFQHRTTMQWRAKYRSFKYPDGSHWAVPFPIAWCESGGDYYASSSGAYGLTEGGGFPQNMPPKMQDEYAYRAFLAEGERPWAPYESGCAYR